MPQPKTVPFFSEKELSCKHCGKNKMVPSFMQKIVKLRRELNFPFVVTSAYRCPAHNKKVSTTGEDGPHTTGRAIDIAVQGDLAYRLVAAALREGFTGIGVSQKGTSRFIHLDDLDAVEHARPRIWSY